MSGGYRTRVNSTHPIARKTAASGTPMSIHWPKPMLTPVSCCRKATANVFGGVPMIVASEPMLAA